MLRTVCCVGTILFLFVCWGFIQPGHTSTRTLTLAEQAALFGGQPGYCCGVPPRCSLPVPNLPCDTYNTDTTCLAATVYWNPQGHNTRECVIVAPSAICISSPPLQICRVHAWCIWDPEMGCYQSANAVGDASAHQTCGDMWCI